MLGPIRPSTSYLYLQPKHTSPPLQRAVGSPRTANISLFVMGPTPPQARVTPDPILHHCITSTPLQFVKSSEQKLP